jgi:hypothetical protein
MDLARLDEIIKRWPTPTSRRWVHHLVSTAENDSRILALVAIGSAVREVSASADVDILVIYADQPLDVRSPIEVDMRQYSDAQAEDLLTKGHDLLVGRLASGASSVNVITIGPA